MRILLVGNYALDNQGSRSRYAEMLRRNLRARGHLVELITPGAVLGRSSRPWVLQRWLAYADKFILFPLKLSTVAQGFDAVHICDHSNAMYLAHTGGVPASITCHDLLDVARAQGTIGGLKGGALFRMRQRQVLRHLLEARHVVCTSSKTSRELGAMREGGNQRRVVIPSAVEIAPEALSRERVQAMRAQLGLAEGDRYLLHVGREQWYRNRPGALRIFRMLRQREGAGLKLVMAGDALTAEMREFVAANLPRESVIEVPRVSDEELWSLYAGATALLFPSLYEGFGWPIAEAQSCGCPVIASNRAPMTEVAGPAALYIDPRDEAGAADTILANLDGLAALREPGFENARRFRAEAVFAAYEGFFKGVLRTRRSTDVVVAANEAETEAVEYRDR